MFLPDLAMFWHGMKTSLPSQPRDIARIGVVRSRFGSDLSQPTKGTAAMLKLSRQASAISQRQSGAKGWRRAAV